MYRVRNNVIQVVSKVMYGVAALTVATSGIAADCDPCTIPVIFTGTYLAETCEVSINNGTEKKAIFLPTISVQHLQQNSNESGSQIFNITLKNCPVDKSIDLHFSSGDIPADSTTGNLTNKKEEGHSRNVQIRLRKYSGEQMIVNDDSSYQRYLIPKSGALETHYFTASYYAKGNGRVTSGKVETLSAINLSYN